MAAHGGSTSGPGKPKDRLPPLPRPPPPPSFPPPLAYLLPLPPYAVVGVLLCLVLDIAFVLSLYVADHGLAFFTAPTTLTLVHREDPRVILNRMRAVALVSAVAWIPLLAVVVHSREAGPGADTSDVLSRGRQIFTTLYLKTPTLRSLVGPVAHISLLYAGPIIFWLRTTTTNNPTSAWSSRPPPSPPPPPRARSRSRPQTSPFPPTALFFSVPFSLHVVRDVVVAPVTEEWIFRSVMLSVLLHTGWSPEWSKVVAPILFGLAHVHHVVGRVVVQKESWSRAVAGVCGQVVYTTVFGMYAADLVLTSGSISTAIVAHAYCNYLGVPPLGEMVERRRGVEGWYRWLLGTGVVAFIACFFVRIP